MLEQILTDPWFWAFLAAVGWGMRLAVVGTKTLGGRLGCELAMLILAEFPHILPTMPFVSQPRIDLNPPLLVAAGAAVLAATLVFGTPVFRIVPPTCPDRREPLRTPAFISSIGIAHLAADPRTLVQG